MSVIKIIVKSIVYTIKSILKAWLDHLNVISSHLFKTSVLKVLVGIAYAIFLATICSIKIVFDELCSLVEDINHELQTKKLKEDFRKTEECAEQWGFPISEQESALDIKRKLAQKIVKSEEIKEEEIKDMVIKSALTGLYFNAQGVQEEDLYEKESSTTDAFSTVREFLWKNKFKLHGKVLKTTYTNISDEELYNCIMENKPLRSCIIQRVTFGAQLNIAISNVCPQYKLTRKSNQSYFTLDENEVFEIEQDLQKIFMNKNITLSLKED